jgi:hypothetical protein
MGREELVCILEGGLAMAWKLGAIQDIDTGLNGFVGPGFVLQQEGKSPSLTMVFGDRRTAEQCRVQFEGVLDKAAAIIGASVARMN